jgi:hypothetical protein
MVVTNSLLISFVKHLFDAGFKLTYLCPEQSVENGIMKFDLLKKDPQSKPGRKHYY